MNKLCLSLLILLFGCSIISDDDLKELPEKAKLTKISASGFDYNYDVPTISKCVGTVSYPTNNKVVVDWSGDLDLFYFRNPVTSITYDLNAAGFATSVSVLLNDGAVVVDQLTYNANNQVTEMIVTNFSSHFKFFYKNNVIDSVSKETPWDNGFYKSIQVQRPEHTMISIYPFTKDKPYTLDVPSNLPCGNNLNQSDNEFYKSFYFYANDPSLPNLENSYGQLVFNPPFVGAEEKVYKDTFIIGNRIELNYFGQIQMIQQQPVNYECMQMHYGLNIFSVAPDLFPDAKLLQILIVAGEFNAIFYDRTRIFSLSDLTLVYEY